MRKQPIIMLKLEQQLLHKLTPWLHSRSFCVAFSGGMDSTVLLHSLVRLAQQHALPALRAIYIHHGLQEAAQPWPAHCQRVCDQLGVPLTVLEVDVPSTASVEQAARHARYAAFEKQLASDEILLMAQHQDDQAETLLFRLLRGTGVKGLQGIPLTRQLQHSRVLRPLLDVSHQHILDYAQQQQLIWVEDPSNATDEFDRNYLRRQVIPLLKRRWPRMLHSMQRTAQHMQEAQQLLNELAATDLRHNQVQPSQSWLTLPCLDLAGLRELSGARQKNLLRHWLAPYTLLPDSAHWAGWEALRDAQQDAQPVWRLHSGALLRSQNRLYWLAEHWLQSPEPLDLIIKQAGRYPLPNNGYLEIAGDLTTPLRVRYRQGAEKLYIEGRGHRDLKRLLQENAVPAFVRSRLPIVYLKGQPVAVANLPALTHRQLQHLRVTWWITDEKPPVQ